MILDIEPVSYLHTVAVDRQALFGKAVVDHQRDKLFGELVGAVVIGAARDVHRHTVGLVICANDKIGRSLGRRIGAVRGKGRSLGEHTGCTECAVNLIR